MARRRLQTTALVNEAYLKLVGQREGDWQNRAHFFAIAAQVMRRILLDDARRALRHKRGGAAPPLPVDDVAIEAPARNPFAPDVGGGCAAATTVGGSIDGTDDRGKRRAACQ
jgi:hypothetical protein